jgi:hypothetical protein
MTHSVVEVLDSKVSIIMLLMYDMLCYGHVMLCMCVCMYICMYVHMYECTYVCTYVCMCICMNVHMYVCMYARHVMLLMYDISCFV